LAGFYTLQAFIVHKMLLRVIWIFIIVICSAPKVKLWSGFITPLTY